MSNLPRYTAPTWADTMAAKNITSPSPAGQLLLLGYQYPSSLFNDSLMPEEVLGARDLGILPEDRRDAVDFVLRSGSATNQAAPAQRGKEE